MNSLLNNKSELFKNAHKVTKIVLGFNPSANYQATFAQVLKAMFAFNGVEKSHELKAKMQYNSRFGNKTKAQIIKEVMNSSINYDAKSAANHVIANIPQNIEKAKAKEQEAAAYYAGRAVTMC